MDRAEAGGLITVSPGLKACFAGFIIDHNQARHRFIWYALCLDAGYFGVHTSMAKSQDIANCCELARVTILSALLALSAGSKVEVSLVRVRD